MKYEYPIGHLLNAKMSIAKIFEHLREVGFVLDTQHQQNLYRLEAEIEQEICSMWEHTVDRQVSQQQDASGILNQIRARSAKTKSKVHK
jgi:gamma-glutamylcysteine synthetase